MSQNQNQGNVQGDEKKKEKSPMKWHIITCDGSVIKKDSKVSVYNQLRLRRSRRMKVGKNTRRGGLNCVFKNVSFLRKIALFSGFRV